MWGFVIGKLVIKVFKKWLGLLGSPTTPALEKSMTESARDLACSLSHFG